MNKVFVRIAIEDEKTGEMSAADRVYVERHHTASLGWCIGGTMGNALVSLSDAIAGSSAVMRDAADGFGDAIREHLRELEGDA